MDFCVITTEEPNILNLKLSSSKNLILLIVLVSLVTLTFWLFMRDSWDESEPQAKIGLGISNDANPDSILLLKKGKSNFLSLQNGSFYFNNNFRIKPELEEALVVILRQLEVRRPVSEKMQETLSMIIDTAGMHVEVYEGENLLSTFEIWGNKEQNQTYILLPESQQIYLANIPGYSTYIADIFFYNESNWKNNVLFESTWRSLRKLDIEYPIDDSKNTTIEYSGEYFNIDQLEAFDTLAVLDYLEQFSKIRVDSYLPDNNRFTDSILNERATLIVKIDDLESAKSNVYSFYRDSIKTEPLVLVIGKDKRVGVITKEKFDAIAKNLDSFLVKGR